MPVLNDDKGWGNPLESPKTFRIQGVPVEWDVERLRSFIEDQEPSLGPSIESLACEIHGRSKTGTISFGVKPNQPEPGKQAWRIALPKGPEPQPARHRYLELDDGFLGMTTLYRPLAEDHKVE